MVTLERTVMQDGRVRPDSMGRTGVEEARDQPDPQV